MIYHWLADLILFAHLLFILFVMLGGLAGAALARYRLAASARRGLGGAGRDLRLALPADPAGECAARPGG